MAMLTVRNLPDEVHRALRVRAASHGRNILEAAVKSEGRIKLGSLLVEIGRRVALTDDEIALIEQVRDRGQARSATFE